MHSELTTGSYTYGPATGITANSWTTIVKYTNGKSGTITTGTTEDTLYGYTFQLGTDGENVNVEFEATASHGVGAIAKDNLGGDSSPVVRILDGAKSNDITVHYTSFRKMFYGTRTDKTALDSDKIRSLSGEKAQQKQKNSLEVVVPVGAKRVIIAVPNTFSVTSIKDRNCMNAELIQSFALSAVNVAGANNYSAVEYKVYTLDFANPNNIINHFDVSVG